MIDQSWIITRRNLDLDALYREDGRYAYHRVWNWWAIAAVLLAVAPVLPGFICAATTPGGVAANPDFLDRLYSYGVFLTFSLAGLLCYTFAKLVRPQAASTARPESATSLLR